MGPKENRESQEIEAREESAASRASQDPLDPRETLVFLDPQDLLESKVFRDPLDHPVLWDPQDPMGPLDKTAK